MRNMIPDARGPAISRKGTEFIREFDGDDGRAYLFSTGETTGYALIFTDTKLFPVSFEGVVPSTNYVANPRFRSGDDDWTTSEVKGSVAFKPDDCTITCDDQSNPRVFIAQEVTIPATDDYRISIGSLGAQTYRVRVGTAADDGTYLDLEVFGGFIGEIVNLPAGAVWVTVINETRNTVVDIQAVGVLDAEEGSGFTTPYSESDLQDLHIIEAPDGSTLYFAHPNYNPYRLAYDYTSDTFSLDVVTFTSKPSEWAGDSWPRTGTFHQGRLYFGGTIESPQRFWASKTNDFENFDTGTAQADEALDFTINQQGDIRWMLSTKNLLIGTTRGELIVTAQDGVIIPNDIAIEKQSAYGSASIQAIQVGDQVFYISPDGRKVRAMQFEFVADNWLSRDITFFAEHLTESRITDITWAQNPDNQFLAVLGNGDVAALTYERSEEVYGWTVHTLASRVKAISSGPVRGEDIILFLVNRKPGKLYFEILRNAPTEYVDSWKRVTLNGANTVAGFDHLEGEEVQVVVDGAVHPNRVVTNGEIEIEYDGNVVAAGFAMPRLLKTLPLDKGSPTGVGTPYTKSYARIYLRLIESGQPLIDGERSPVRTPSTPMGDPQPFVTGLSEISRLQWGAGAQLTIEQDLPVPLTVASIAADLAQEKL